MFPSHLGWGSSSRSPCSEPNVREPWPWESTLIGIILHSQLSKNSFIVFVNIYLLHLQCLFIMDAMICLRVFIYFCKCLYIVDTTSVCMYAHTPAEGARPHLRHLRATTWLPGLKLGTSGIAGIALHCRAVSPAPSAKLL